MGNINTQKKRSRDQRKQAEWLANDIVQAAGQMRTFMNRADKPLQSFAIEDLIQAKKIIESALADDKVRKEFKLGDEAWS